MGSTEAALFWASTLLLALSFGLCLATLIFKRAAATVWAGHISLLAWLILTALVVVRWFATGHPPFVTLFESMITAVWSLLLLALLIRWRASFDLLLLPVSFVSFLMLGWASSMSTAASPLSSALDNVWLFIHASFATCGAAAFLIAASFSAVLLLGEERLNALEGLVKRMPQSKDLPQLTFHFLILGLVLWGVMIVSGSIWANAAWGRYWAWDPIELWSLISWLLYGLVIHARMVFKMGQRRFCWLTIIAALTVVFSLWGVGYVYETIHEYG